MIALLDTITILQTGLKYKTFGITNSKSKKHLHILVSCGLFFGENNFNQQIFGKFTRI